MRKRETGETLCLAPLLCDPSWMQRNLVDGVTLVLNREIRRPSSSSMAIGGRAYGKSETLSCPKKQMMRCGYSLCLVNLADRVS